MSKDLYISAHEELMEQYMLDNPDADCDEAYRKTEGAVYQRYMDKFSDLIDQARMRAKEPKD